MRTSLHSEGGTDAENHDEQDEGCKARRRGAVPRVTNSTHDDKENGRSHELYKNRQWGNGGRHCRIRTSSKKHDTDVM